MNRIIVKDNDVKVEKKDKKIEFFLDQIELLPIKKVNITVLEDTELEIIYENTKDVKIDIEYNIKANIKITEIRKELEIKAQYKYNIEANSEVEVIKFYDNLMVKELDIINLNGINAKIKYNFKTIARDKQKYDMIIYHNSKDTQSNIFNNSINIDNGTTIFDVTSVVYNGITNCILNQTNKIINLNDSSSIINPNLLIEESDVSANHSAFIGKFDINQIFYLMSRGIKEEEAINLLIKGFLSEGINNEEINNMIQKYWR